MQPNAYRVQRHELRYLLVSRNSISPGLSMEFSGVSSGLEPEFFRFDRSA